MNKKRQWNQSSFAFVQRKSHNGNLIGLCQHTNNTFLTSSEDATVRLWDIRSQSSIKLIRNKVLTQQLSNPQTDNQSAVYIGSSTKLYQFDLRKQSIFIEQFSKQCTQKHYDNINKIKYSAKYKQILCCDDEGDIRSYDTLTLQCKNCLEQQHSNICNAVDYLYTDGKQFQGKKICVSGGFDSTLIFWNIQDQNPIKKVPLTQIFNKYQIKIDNGEFPFIHSISTYGSSALVGIQSGHILCIPIQQPKKPKFILKANLTRITDCKVSNIVNKNIMITTAIDDSFCLFDYEQRVDGQPKFIQKYGTIAQPIQVQAIETTILVVCNSPALSFYSIKQ